MQLLSSLTALNDIPSGSIPSHTQIPYSIPPLPALLSLAAYLYLISAASSLADRATHAPLIGPLITGVLLGPSLAGLLSPSTQQTFISLGYIGLILIVFEAGLTTHIPLLLSNIGVSTVAALTGVILPIALSLALLHGAYGFTKLQSFAAGAALCSTSLGTTLALLTPRLRKTRVGSVLMCAALLDDVVGLVIAGIIANLAESEEGGVKWETVVRPVLVSIAFGLGSPALAWMMRWILRREWRWLWSSRQNRRGRSKTPHGKASSSLICDTRMQLFFIVCTLSGFVAGSSYAGTSELFGAYLAGVFLAYVFGDLVGETQASRSSSPPHPVIEEQPHLINTNGKESSVPDTSLRSFTYTEPVAETEPKTPSTNTSLSEAHNPTVESFNIHIAPILTPLLGPILFASVGAALPVGSMFTTTTSRSTISGGGKVKSHSVVWKGLVYALLMAFAKAAVGLWMLVWRDKGRSVGKPDHVELDGTGDGMKTIAVSDAPRPDASRDVERGTNANLDTRAITGPDAFSPFSSGQTVNTTHPGSSPASKSTHEASNLSAHSSKSTRTQPPRLTQPDIPIPTTDSEPSPVNAGLLLGLAMIARGEIALIVAQLARPLLVGGRADSEEEPYAVVIWAIVLGTLGGALGVGWLLGMWKRS